jgi:beta-mannosidase
VKDLLKVGPNLLEIEISPTNVFDAKGQSENRMPFDYAHTRKPCYQYSWDWAPFMNTLGVWKNVYIESYDRVSIDYVWIQLQELS